MSSSKKHNSIVFLTTLSVYLGLVLVGATPSVLAQAALTRNFDIQEEIEYKDDLDKKPDEDLFALPLSRLINDLNNLSATGLFNWSKKSDFRIESFSICKSDNSPSFMGSGSVNPIVDVALERTSIKISRHLFKKLSDLGLGDTHSHGSDFKFVLDNNSLKLTTEISVNGDKNIQPFVDSLTKYFAQISSSKTAKLKIVAENTKVTFENNQVFLITNLPRASIDSLLADKDAN